MLCAKIFKIMTWNIDYRYKIMAVYQEIEDLKFCVFNLSECEMYVPDEMDTGDGSKKKKRRKVFPIDWESSFGTPFAEFESTFDTDINSLHLLSDSTLDDLTEKPKIIPRIPTSREKITSPYYTPDDITGKGKKK